MDGHSMKKWKKNPKTPKCMQYSVDAFKLHTADVALMHMVLYANIWHDRHSFG